MATVVDLADKLREVRTQRYALQSVARKALPNERVSKCLRRVQNGQVEVWKHLNTNKSFYNGLLVCGSVWNCPLCSAKISERRKLELKTAFDMHTAEGGKIALLTLTFRHKKTDVLKDTIKNFTSATSKFRTGKRYQKIRDRMNVVGSIRVFEITYGKNGFHPHIHIAIFYFNDVNLDEIKFQMTDLWEKACAKYGLSILSGVGLDLQDGEKANEYLSKHGSWSLEQEMSKSHVKTGKQGSLTPFDFLRFYLDSEDPLYLHLFKEYATALKGKTQCYWSRGLKSRFLIDEKSDEETAKESLEEADLLGIIPYEIWKIILKRDLRSNFLDWVEKNGFDSAFEFICKFVTDKEVAYDIASFTKKNQRSGTL
jgi:hypothetical protein